MLERWIDGTVCVAAVITNSVDYHADFPTGMPLANKKLLGIYTHFYANFQFNHSSACQIPNFQRSNVFIRIFGGILRNWTLLLTFSILFFEMNHLLCTVLFCVCIACVGPFVGVLL